jgi:proteasome lid subunit RPN8/RPN11
MKENRVLRLPRECRAGIEGLCRAAAGVETGGLLLGEARMWPLSRSGYAVRTLTGPGPNASASATSLDWDSSYVLGFAQAAALLGGVDVLGRWHKHPSGSTLPSPTDVEWAHAFRELLALPAVVDLIVACVEDEPVDFAAYLCTPAGYKRITCS